MGSSTSSDYKSPEVAATPNNDLCSAAPSPASATGNDVSPSSNSLASSSISINSTLFNAYTTLGYTALALGQKATDAEIDAQYERLCDTNYGKVGKLDKLGIAYRFVTAQRSTGAKIQRFFLNWSEEQRRFYVLSGTFWIALSLLCVCVGSAIKVDCDENCSRQKYCNVTFDEKPCFDNCRATHWIVALSGVILLDFLLLLVVGATLYFFLAECCNCEGIKNTYSRETFTTWGRLLVLTFCATLLVGSFGTMLKLSVEQDGVGPKFLKSMPWQGVFAFGYFAYFLFCVSYLVKIWVGDFLTSATKSGINKLLLVLGFGSNFISAFCPLVFFVIVGINVDRNYGDKFRGFTVTSPLLTFFSLRIISALIIPFSNGFVNKVKIDESRRILRNKALSLIGLYILCIAGLVFAGFTVNEQRVDCPDDVFWKWVFAMIPLYLFFGIIVMTSFSLFVGLKCCCKEGAEKAYKSLTSTIVELILRPAAEEESANNSQVNFHQQQQQGETTTDSVTVVVESIHNGGVFGDEGHKSSSKNNLGIPKSANSRGASRKTLDDDDKSSPLLQNLSSGAALSRNSTSGANNNDNNNDNDNDDNNGNAEGNDSDPQF